MARFFTGLWQHPDFLKLWFGQTLSEFGSRITREALPLIAVIVLAASPDDIGLLVALASVPVFIFGLFIGVPVDRLRRRPLMIAADALRLLLVLLLPIAAFTGNLTMPLLMLITALMSLLGLLFQTAYCALMPTLIQHDQLADGNAKLATTDSLAEIGGPAIAGFLIQAVGAPLAVLFDAISYLFSIISISLIRQPEPTPQKAQPHSPIWDDVRAGVRLIAHDPVLRVLASSLGCRTFFGNFFAALYAYYAIQELSLTPASLGVLVSMGGIGALAGAFVAGRLRWHTGTILRVALLIHAVSGFFVPLAWGSPILIFGMMAAAQIVGDAAMMVYSIHEITLRQRRVPNAFLGRANATMDFIAEGIAPLGALVGGAIAAATTARFGLLIAMMGILLVALSVNRSALRHIKATEA